MRSWQTRLQHLALKVGEVKHALQGIAIRIAAGDLFETVRYAYGRHRCRAACIQPYDDATCDVLSMCIRSAPDVIALENELVVIQVYES